MSLETWSPIAGAIAQGLNILTFLQTQERLLTQSSHRSTSSSLVVSEVTVFGPRVQS